MTNRNSLLGCSVAALLVASTAAALAGDRHRPSYDRGNYTVNNSGVILQEGGNYTNNFALQAMGTTDVEIEAPDDNAYQVVESYAFGNQQSIDIKADLELNLLSNNTAIADSYNETLEQEAENQIEIVNTNTNTATNTNTTDASSSNDNDNESEAESEAENFGLQGQLQGQLQGETPAGTTAPVGP
jgi:hypothetical protein